MGLERDHAALGGVRFEGFLYWAWYDANGLFHRVCAPAVIYDSGHKIWYQHGRLHCSNGPAVTWEDGTEEWWIQDRYITSDVLPWMATQGIFLPFTPEQQAEFLLRWS